MRALRCARTAFRQFPGSYETISPFICRLHAALHPTESGHALEIPRHGDIDGFIHQGNLLRTSFAFQAFPGVRSYHKKSPSGKKRQGKQGRRQGNEGNHKADQKPSETKNHTSRVPEGPTPSDGNNASGQQAADMAQDGAQESRASKDSEKSEEAPKHATTEARQEPSPEEDKYAAEFQRVAGLNKLEKGQLTDPVNPLSFLVDLFRHLQGRLALGVMHFQDKDFDEPEFLEGAKDAFFIVMTLWNEHDFTTLSTMTSGKLLSALRKGVEDYSDKNMSVRMSLAGDIQASLASFDLIMEDTLAEYDFPEDSGLARSSGRSSAARAPDGTEETHAETIADTAGGDDSVFSVVTVRFQCDQQITVVSAGGQVVQEVTDKRHQLWRFVRGPLVGYPLLHLPRDRPAPSWWLLDFV